MTITQFMAMTQAHAQSDIEEIKFYSDEREVFVDFKNAKSCEVLNDDTTNFTVEITSTNGFNVVANGAYKRSAMLVLICEDGEKVYQLDFINRPKNKIDDYYSILKRPDSYVRLEANYLQNGKVNIGTLLHDHSYKFLKLTMFRNYRDIENPDWYSTGANVSHSVTSNLDFGYGYNQSLFENEEKINHSGWINLYGVNMFLLRGYNNLDETKYDFSFIFPAPILLRYRYLEDFDNTLTRSISRAFFINLLPELSQRTFLSYSLMKLPNSDQLSKKLEVENKLFIQPYFGINIIQELNGFCLTDQDCKISFIGVSSRLRTQNIVGSPEYGIYPHYAAIDLAYRFRGNQEIGIYYKKPFEQLGALKDKPWLEDVNEEEESTFNTTVKLEYRYSQYYYTLRSTIPAYPQESRKEAFLGLDFRNEGDRFIWGGGVSGRPFLGDVKDYGFRMFIKKHFDKNLKYVSEAIQDHEISGTVRLGSDKQPLRNVQLALYELKSDQSKGKKIKSNSTNRYGRYRFSDIKETGQFLLEIEYEGIVETVPIFKERSQIHVKYDHTIDDQAIIQVETYIDINENGRVDGEDRKLALPVYDEMVEEALVKGKGLKYERGAILFNRLKKPQFRINREMIPSPYKFMKFHPKELKLSKSKFHTLYILLEKP